jgi:hypothetical protein
MYIKLLQVLLEDLKISLILNEYSDENNFEDTHKNLKSKMNEVYDILGIILKKDK